MQGGRACGNNRGRKGDNRASQLRMHEDAHEENVSSSLQRITNDTIRAHWLARRRTTLKDHGLGLVGLHDAVDDGLKQPLICCVINAVPQRHIHSVVLASACT